ncbi:hypothetical protein D3C83_320110 [compost metagenome]
MGADLEPSLAGGGEDTGELGRRMAFFGTVEADAHDAIEIWLGRLEGPEGR